MSLETATFIDSLVTSNPDGADQRSTADDHLRLIKACLKRSFPQVAGAVSASAQAISYVNDLSASAQAQLNALREGSATANNAINAQFANSASKASVIGTIAAANVPDLSGVSNTFVGAVSNLEAPIVLKSTNPGMLFNDTNAATDEHYWRFRAAATGFVWETLDDSASATVFLEVRRTGSALRDISISCSAVYVNGYSVLSPPGMNGVAAASYARLDAAQTFAKGNGSTIVALTDGSTITPNCEDGNVFRLVIGGDRTMAAPDNPRSGQTIVFHIIQSGAAGHTLAWNSIYKFAGSVDPTLTVGNGARDVFAFNYDSVSGVWAQAGLNVG
jgi:hypothetical protein